MGGEKPDEDHRESPVPRSILRSCLLPTLSSKTRTPRWGTQSWTGCTLKRKGGPPARGGTLKTKLKTVLLQLSLSWLAAAVLGATAMFLYFSSYCWNGGTDCAAYSPIRRWIAFLLAAPIFVMQRWVFGTVDNVANFDPVVFGRFGWLALWAYYFAITSGGMRLATRLRRRGGTR